MDLLAKSAQRMLGAPFPMDQAGNSAVSKRAKRIEQAVLEVDGVVAVRVWELPDHVEIGVVPGRASRNPQSEVLRHAWSR